MRADGRYAFGAGEHQLALKAEAPTLNRLQPLWRLLPGLSASTTLAGSLQVDATLDGRWPALRSSGRLDATGLRAGDTGVQQARARWQVGMAGDAPLEADIELRDLRHLSYSAESATLVLKGTPRAHELRVDLRSRALPPAWVELLQPAASACARGTHAGTAGAEGQPAAGRGRAADRLARACCSGRAAR